MNLPDRFCSFAGLYENELPTFDIYFASVCSMQFHPGAGTKEHRKLSIDECRDIAVKMIKSRRSLAAGG